MTDLDFQRSVNAEIVRRIREGELTAQQEHLLQLKRDFMKQSATLLAKGWDQMVADSMRLTLEMWESAVRDE
jgi:hypothetical protein